MVIILTNQLDQGTHNIRDLLSSEIDFPKTFSHVVDIEISKCHLRCDSVRWPISSKMFGALRAPISIFRLPVRASARDGYMQISLVQPKSFPRHC